ncbi:MAG: hypothetical protein ACR2N6_04270, partial [Miltoncostaeaceae bacterium]
MPWSFRARGVLLLGVGVLLLLTGPRTGLASEPEPPRVPGLTWVGVDAEQRLRFDSPIGPLLVQLRALNQRPSVTWLKLKQSVDRVAAEGLRTASDEPWTWQHAPTLGHHLYSHDRQRIVLPGALLVRERLPRRNATRERGAVKDTADALRRAAQAHPEISPWMAGALAEV